MNQQSAVTKAGSSGALFGLGLLGVINFVNYLDRYVVAGVLAKVEAAFSLTHEQAGLLGGIFMAVYMLASPLAGYLGDRVQRRLLVAASVFLWSLATVASGLAGGFATLMLARAVTGIGEAGYGSVAPAIISDLFPVQKRTRMLAFFYTAMPLGAAAGFLIGGYFGEHHSWSAAFYVSGLPGLVLAALALKMPEPERGAMDAGPVTKVKFKDGLRSLSGNGLFWLTTASLTMMTFSIGGLAFWMPAYLEKERGMAGTTAGLVLGGITVVAGMLGTLAGGILGDRLDRRFRNGGAYLAGAGLMLAAPFMLLVAHLESRTLMLAALFATQFLVFLNSGPLNATIVNAVSPAMRSFAMGLNTLIIHLLGDTLSPPLIGSVAQRTSLGTAIQLNALPVVLGGLLLVLLLGRVRKAPEAPSVSA